jgi:hypothetical protein
MPRPPHLARQVLVPLHRRDTYIQCLLSRPALLEGALCVNTVLSSRRTAPYGPDNSRKM